MHPTLEKETRQAGATVADGSWSRDLVSQPFLEEEEMVANTGGHLFRAPWLYIPSQPSVTPEGSEFPNYVLHCFVIFKAERVPPGTGPDFFTSRAWQWRLWLDKALTEGKRAFPCAKVAPSSFRNSQIKTVLKGSMNMQSNTSPERKILGLKSVPKCGKGEAIILVLLLTS